MTRAEKLGTAAGLALVVCCYFGFDVISDQSKPKPVWLASHSTPYQPELLSPEVIEVVELSSDSEIRPVVHVMETEEPPMAENIQSQWNAGYFTPNLEWVNSSKSPAPFPLASQLLVEDSLRIFASLLDYFTQSTDQPHP